MVKSQTNREQKSNLLFLQRIINIEEFDSNLLKIGKKSYKDIGIYYIGYITIKKLVYCENIYSVNPLYLIIGKVNRHIKEKNESKYLVFDSTDENKEVSKKDTELQYGIKNEIEIINGGKKGEYGNYFMKIKFNTDNNLLLNKPLKLHLLTIIARCIFEEDIKFYLQLYLDDCLHDLKTMIQLDRTEDSPGIDLNRTDKSKECKICYYNYFKNGFKSDSKVCNDGDWGIKSVGNFAIMYVNGFGYRFLMFDMTKEDVIEFIKDIEPNDEF